MNLRLDTLKNKFVATFPYNPEWVARLRSIPGSRFSIATRMWTLPVDMPTLSAMREHFPSVTLDPGIVAWETSLSSRASLNTEQKTHGPYTDTDFTSFPFKTKPYEHQLKALDLMIHNDSFALLHEMGCVDGDTLINHPDGTSTRIETLASTHKNFEVICVDRYLNVRTGVSAGAFRKGTADLFSVQLDSGKEILCTMSHVFLTELGWRPLSQIRVGCSILSLTASSLGSQPSSTSGISPSVSRVDGQRSSGKYVDWTGDCFAYCHRCGQLLRFEEDSGRSSSPSQADAPSPFSHALCSTDGLAHRLKHNHPCRPGVRQTMMDSDPHVGCDHVVDHVSSGVGSRNRLIPRGETLPGAHSCIDSSSGLVHGVRCSAFKPPLKYDMDKSIRWGMVRKIKYVKTADFYDMHVPYFENYVANGIINHNTGKTFTTIQMLSHLKRDGQIKPALVVCPLSVCSVWKNQIAQHADNLTCEVLTGERYDRREKLKRPADVYVVNYEGLRILEGELSAKAWGTVICDESQKIKNRTAKQSKIACRLGRGADRRYILTGTMIVNNPLDAFGQFLFLNPAILGHNYFGFQNTYAVMVTHGRARFPVRFINIDKLAEKIAPWSHRVTKAECLDLPEKIYETRYVELNERAHGIYKKLGTDLMVELKGGKIISAPIILTKLLRFSQITAGFVTSETGEIEEVGDEKLGVLKELIEECEGKAVVWVKFRHELEMVCRLLEKIHVGYVSLSGETSQPDREAGLKRFHGDDVAKVFVSQIEAGGVGIDLTPANLCIYMSNSYSLGSRLQSEDRLHRLMQKSNVTYIDIIAAGTIDEKIISLLKQKKSAADIVNGDVKNIMEDLIGDLAKD